MALNYNVLDKTNFTTYSLVYEVQMTDPEAFCLKLTASRVDGKVGGMTIIEVGIPTGYTVDTTNPDYNVNGSKMQEIEGRNYVLYYDEVKALGWPSLFSFVLLLFLTHSGATEFSRGR